MITFFMVMECNNTYKLGQLLTYWRLSQTVKGCTLRFSRSASRDIRALIPKPIYST